MTKEELLQGIRDGRLTGDSLDDFDEEDWPSAEGYFLFFLGEQPTDIKYDGEPLEFIEQSTPTRDYSDHDLHGRPLKYVWKIGNATFVAIGAYDSWEGEHFPDGFHEAELVNVPTWLPKP